MRMSISFVSRKGQRSKALWIVLPTLLLCAASGGLRSYAVQIAGAAEQARTRAVAADSAADEKAIRATAEAYIKAYNAADAKALAGLWTQDGDYVDQQGQVFHGREAIERELATAFEGQEGLKLEIQVESIRFLGADVASEQGIARVVPPSGTSTTARYFAIHVRRDGKWLMASVHDSAHVAASNEERLKDLQWLIGDWTSTNGDQTLRMKCEWIANKNFMRRTFNVSAGNVGTGDKAMRSGEQIIGWDPRAGQIASWHFDSEGGFGRDLWTKDKGQWIIDANAVLRDGSESTATNLMKPIDQQSFTWQSIDRTLDGEELPDTEEITVTRVAPKR